MTRQAQYAAKQNKQGDAEEEDNMFGGVTPDNPTRPSEENVKQQHANSKKGSDIDQHPTVRALGHLLGLDESPPGTRPEPAEPAIPGGLEENVRRLNFEDFARQKMASARAWEASCIHSLVLLVGRTPLGLL